MIISPPFLPAAGLRNSDATANPPILDLMMDEVDKYELAHGNYPIAFDRRWHCGAHLMPSMQNEKVRAIADGEVVAYRVCQKAYDGGGGTRDSNAGFVLLKHTTETGEGRTLTFYSLYMHLLDLSSYNGADGRLLPEFLQMPTPGGDTEPSPAQKGVNLKVRRKDVLGWVGACHAQQHLHFEIFMTKADHDAYFGRTQLGKRVASMATGNDCWGHIYYVIPAGSSFRALPPGVDSHNKLNGIAFDALQAGRNAEQLFVEMFFHKGSKFTNVWAVSGESRTLLTPTPVKEAGYEYDMYKRATALYPACPSDGYELLRFGRILSPSPTLGLATGATPPPVDASVQGNPRPRDAQNPRATWTRVTFAAGREGYIDVSPDTILKLSDADFSGLAGWEKISEGNTPFSADGLCDIDALKKIVKDTKEHQTPQQIALKEEHTKEDVLANYVKSNKAVREQLRGFVCEAPSEWDSSHNEERYRKLKDEGEFYHGDEDGYKAFIKLLKSFQFWDKTGFASGEKLWFFHPLAFVRHFRKCGWLSKDELAATFPRYPFYTETGDQRSAITTNNDVYRVTMNIARQRLENHAVALNECTRKYIGSNSQRLALFLAQVFLETAQWRNPGGTKRLMHEWGFGRYSAANPATQYYGPFYGHGIMQLTWAGNFAAYGQYRGIPVNSSDTYVERLPGAAARITKTSRHYSANPADGGELMLWYPRYDPDLIAENVSYACDSGGFYWVSKRFSRGINISRVADEPFSPSNIGFINRLVNGGGNGYYERQAYSVYILSLLNDKADVSEAVTITPPSPKSSILANMLRPE
ncbi:hypothetical protein AWB75_02922 [Caballeronia catudaia]|uniref:Uncharacterized protein n=1 Tax=Caballeronia catudaia TaxID=1777136 RepID=A0A158B2N6_9BURK|nr:M23 family metallopeptidase [Caballeronia catudaia]SAK64283.1 hypothetical protein AWB75_02922 [Caballeronia catudaia]